MFRCNFFHVHYMLNITPISERPFIILVLLQAVEDRNGREVAGSEKRLKTKFLEKGCAETGSPKQNENLLFDL